VVEDKLDVASSLFTKHHFPLYISQADERIWKKVHQASEPLVTESSRLYMGLGGITQYLVSDNTGIPCIKGADIYRYGIRDDFLYLPRGLSIKDSNLEVMVKPKILVQRIVAHVTTPYPHIILMASLDEKGCLVHETVTYISQRRYADGFICALLNSALMSHIVYTLVYNRAVRTMDLIEPYGKLIPIRRINFTTAKAECDRLVEEGKKLYQGYLKTKDWNKVLRFVGERLPQKPDGTPDVEHEQSDVVHDLLAFLVEEMTRLHKEKQTEIKGFLNWLEAYLGVSVEELKNKTKIKEYYKAEVGWEGFRDALEQNRKAVQLSKDIDVSRREPQETIRAEFDPSVAKLRPVLERIELTDKLIDQIVYRLYGLTNDEIAVVEGQQSHD
jgi:hypothetical protein